MAKVKASILTVLDGKIVREHIGTEAATVEEVLEILARKYGPVFREDIYDGGEIKNFYVVLHNGMMIDRSRPEKALLSDGDTIHIFPPVSGG